MSQTLVNQREQTKPDASSQANLAGPKTRQDDPLSAIFWESPTLEELAHAQNVQPMTDVQVLFGTWPGDEDDGFEEAIDELRHPASAKNGQPE